jgi:hypothetical protein
MRPPALARAALAASLALSLAPAAVRADDDVTCTPAGAIALDGLGTPWDDLVRAGVLTGAVAPGPGVLRRGGARVEQLCAEARLPWAARAGLAATAPVGPGVAGADGLRLIPLRLDAVYDQSYPSGANDGLLWAGRGLSSMLAGGVAFRRGVFSGALAPEVAWSQNRWFALPGNGETGDLRFRDPYYGAAIDLPTRFGSSNHRTASLGQSYLRVDVWNVGLGISTENRWHGPGLRNALTLSNAGPGFPHVFLGTSRPANIGIGTLEGQVFWGRLSRTSYEVNPTHPLLQGLLLDYTPRWVPGLSVGLSRLYMQVWDDLRLRDWFGVFQSPQKQDLSGWYGPTGDNPRDNQLFSLFFRWVFPGSQLQIYGEWGREDAEQSLDQVIREYDHSQAHLIGLEKIFEASGDRWVRVQAEVTGLQEKRPLANARGVPVWYVHGNDLSMTNQGQLLGAWIGPGADSQTLAVDVFSPGGRLGGYVERVRRRDDVYWAVIEPTHGQRHHDVEVAAGVRQVLFAGPVDLSWDAQAAYRWERDFLFKNEPNLRIGLQLAVPFGPRAGALTPATPAARP